VTEAPAAPRVVIVDDQALIRAGFRMILTADGIDVVGEASDGAEAVETVRRTLPDVVLMDIRMPNVDGLEATRRILADPTLAAGPPRVIILTTFDLDRYVYDALRSGAAGFLLKNVTPEYLAAAVRLVRTGDALLAPTITRRLVERFARGGPDGQPRAPHRDLSPLTGREIEVLEQMARAEQHRTRRSLPDQPRHDQDPRRPDPHQTPGPRPRPSGDRRLRGRAGHARAAARADPGRTMSAGPVGGCGVVRRCECGVGGHWPPTHYSSGSELPVTTGTKARRPAPARSPRSTRP
jgi:DNA-binding NarL/FixJ family response regulator